MVKYLPKKKWDWLERQRSNEYLVLVLVVPTTPKLGPQGIEDEDDEYDYDEGEDEDEPLTSVAPLLGAGVLSRIVFIFYLLSAICYLVFGIS
jgi:hypothetical protein